MAMNNFYLKSDIHNYILTKFSKLGETVILTNKASFSSSRYLKSFTNVEVEIYGKQAKKPYCDLIFFHEKPVLLKINFFKLKEGQVADLPEGMKVLQGEYTDSLEQIKSESNLDKLNLSKSDKTTLENQRLIDSFFSYMRTKEDKYLEDVQRKLRM